jgi:hypothetical protein
VKGSDTAVVGDPGEERDGSWRRGQRCEKAIGFLLFCVRRGAAGSLPDVEGGQGGP